MLGYLDIHIRRLGKLEGWGAHSLALAVPIRGYLRKVTIGWNSWEDDGPLGSVWDTGRRAKFWFWEDGANSTTSRW